MASTEQLIFDIVTRDRASDGITKVGSAARDAAGNVDSLTRRLDDVGRKTATARLQLAGDKDAQASLDKIDAKIVSLDRRTASPNITIEGAARATAEISALDVELDKLGKKGGSAESATSAVGSGGLAGPGGIMALVGAGVALAPVIATTSVGLAGFGAAAAATIAPVLAAGTATKAQQEALAGLDPAQRAAYTSLGALKGQFSGFAKTLEPDVIGVFNQGLKLAGGLLGDVEPVAASTGKALGTVVGEISADFKTQQWQQFFGWMAQTAGPDVQLLGGLFVALMNDLPPLLEELQPLATMLINVGKDAAVTAGDLMLLNPALDNASVTSAKLQTNSGNMFTRFLASSKTVLSQVTGIGKSTADAAAGTAGLGAKAAAAAPQVGTLAGDLGVLASNTTVATDATKAWDDMWAIFVGKSVSDQQAVLNMAGAFDTYNTTLKTNKANSTVAQQSFLSIITTMGSGLSTLQANGASVRTLNSFYQTNIDKLKALHGLTPTERADVQGITKDYLTWANTTNGLTRQTVAAAGVLKTQFLAQIGSIAAHAPGVSGDITTLANSILKTGNNSSATRADRAKLIADLEAAGVKADAARGLVNKLQGQIDAMHGKTVAVGAVAHGSGAITATENILGEKTQKLGSLTFVAAGGKVTGGIPGKDSVLLAAMPGEVVVPTHMVAAGAVDHLRGQLPGFAAGGVVGQGIPDWMGGMDGRFVKGAANAGSGPLMAAFLAAASSAAVKAITVAQQGHAAAGPGGGSPAANYALAQALYPAYKGTSVMAAWNYVAMRESGWNQFARNPSSGAYGIPQALPESKLPFAGQAAGGSNPSAQIQWMWNYMASSYGGPIGAAQHEAAFNWYGNGLDAVIGKRTLIGVGESGPEHVTVTPVARSGGGGRGGDIYVTVNAPVGSHPREIGRQLATYLAEFKRGGGWVYKPGGF